MSFPARLALAALLLSSAPASATWSIILIDTCTGEIAVGSATCLASFDLRAGTPVLIPGVGAATAQSFVDSTGQNRVLIRDRLSQGLAPAQILAELATFDAGHQTRQYGLLDHLGRAATFTGTSAGAWAGGQTGQFTSTYAGHTSTIAYAVQGNVLTGEPVVTAAVQAITTTPGDLAAKLMAGMHAARTMGGDGRCSCSSAAPTACGAPPATFTKSAHIAYMLIARAGDREGSNGVYRAGTSPQHLAVADFNNDTRPDLLVTNASSNFSVQYNTTQPGAPFPTFGPLPANTVTSANARPLAVGDVTGDTRPDVLIANLQNISLFRALPAGGFGPAEPHTLAGVRAIALGNLDAHPAPDLAAAVSPASVAVRHNDGAGAFSGNTTIAVEAGPADLLFAQLVGSPALDLAVLCQTANRLVILEGDGAGGFTQAASLPTQANPIALTSGDFNSDNQTDLAITCSSALTVQVFLNSAGAFTPASISTVLSGLDIVPGDVDRDGDTDLVITSGQRFGVLRNNGQGVFTHERSYALAGSPWGAALSDLDADGDLDLALANNTFSSFTTVRNDGPGPNEGTFNDGIGCATGDYWMNFNIAFQSAAAPDPVLQLQTQYDAWRTALLGRPDAVRSTVTLSPNSIAAGSTSAMTIALRDWQGQPITAPITSVQITNTAGIAAIGPVVNQGGGVYTATLTVAGATFDNRTDAFRITVDDGLRPVTLMPTAVLSIQGSCYPNCDMNIGVVPILNVADFTCFLQTFAAGNPYANCDSSTTPPTLNIADFTCFLQRFAVGCP